MTRIPTTSELGQLGIALRRDGFAAHATTIAALVEIARNVGPYNAALDVLGDESASDTVRARAFSKVTARWPDYLRKLRGRDDDFESAFAELLAWWHTHEQLKNAESPVGELYASRTSLDALRLQTARARGQVGAC